MTTPDPTLASLLELVEHLRGPDGCPWDREQEIADIRGYLLEEAHELAEAIDSGDWTRIRDELGDLLFQIAFISRLAQERSAFELDEAVATVHQKMVERHPHVFGNERLADSRAVHQAWEKRKLRDDAADGSVLSGLPRGLPSLLATYRMTQKASGVGFDWPDPEAVLAKVDEELDEVRRALADAPNPSISSRVRSELGDLMFTIANLSRHLGHDPEAVLANANNKFRRRFERMEEEVARGDRTLADLDLETLEEMWRAAKDTVAD